MTRASAHSKRDGQPGTGGAQPRLTAGLARVGPIAAVSPLDPASGSAPAGHRRLLARPHWHGPHWHAVEHARSALSHLDKHPPAAADPGRTARVSQRGHHERRRMLAAALGSERGDTLIEILASSLVLAVIATGTYMGMAAANRATAEQRARSQANTIAQADEEKVRAESIEHLFEGHASFERVREVTENGTAYSKTSGYTGTVFTVKTTGEEKTESGGSTCSATETPTAGFYAETKTEVTWRFAHKNEAVVETGMINQPSSTSLIARVVNAMQTPIEGMNVRAIGPEASPATYSTLTSSSGCSLFSMSEGGRYKVNVWRTGYSYVDPDWYAQSESDPALGQGVVQLVTNVPTKKEFVFEKPGAIKVSFATRLKAGSQPVEARAINAVAYEPEMKPKYAALGRKSTTPCLPAVSNPTKSSEWSTSITSPTCVFPFMSTSGVPSKYVVFAGTCNMNQPQLFGSGYNTAPYEYELPVEAEKTAEPAGSLLIPAVILRVYKKATTELVSAPTVYVTDTDTATSGEECDNEKLAEETKTTGWTNEEGVLKSPALPFGTYTVCTQWEGAPAHWWEPAATYSARAENVKLSNTAEGTILELFQTPESKQGTKSAYKSNYKSGGC